MRRSTCLRSTNGAKATKSSTVRLPKLRSSNKHSGSKHIDYSGNSDGGDGDDKCNQKYISLVCNIRNNQPATKCCWVLWKLLFFFSSLLFFLFLFGSTISETYEKQLFGFFFHFKPKPKKKKLIYCSYVSEMGARNARSHKFSFSAWINFNKEHNKSFQSVNNNNIRSKNNNNNNHNHTNLNSSKMPVYNIIARRHKVREISIQQ